MYTYTPYQAAVFFKHSFSPFTALLSDLPKFYRSPIRLIPSIEHYWEGLDASRYKPKFSSAEWVPNSPVSLKNCTLCSPWHLCLIPSPNIWPSCMSWVEYTHKATTILFVVFPQLNIEDIYSWWKYLALQLSFCLFIESQVKKKKYTIVLSLKKSSQIILF